MQNIIEIKEKGNRLYLSKEYEPIVCGNTNYFIKFTFSEDWASCLKKTAFFVVEGKKIPVMFEGDICNIPAMPNMSSFLVFLVAAPTDGEILSSTPIKLNLERNPSMDKLKKTDPFKSYYASLLGAINKIETGKVKIQEVEYAKTSGHSETAEVAESSETQVSKTGNEDISGVKNFVDGIKINGEAISPNDAGSNPNLLINGDFKINQRGGTTYVVQNNYTVDRWKLVNGSVSVSASGITLNGTITQTLEKIPTGVLTASCDQSGGAVQASYANGVFTLSAENVLIKWAKLEVGSIATVFVPKTISQEIADCQRYYYKLAPAMSYSIFASGGLFISNSEVRFTIPIPVAMRVSPTIKKNGSLRVMGCYNENCDLVTELKVIYYTPYTTTLSVTVKILNTISPSFKFTACEMRADNDISAYIEFDAEIY